MVNRPKSAQFATSFKPGEFIGAAAIWFDVPNDAFRPDAPNGKYPPADAIDFDAWVFNTAADVKAGTPSVELKYYTTNKKGLVRPLKSSMGDQIVGKLGKAPTDKGNPAYVLEDVDDDTYDSLIQWWEARTQARQAAKAAVPAFLQ